VSPCDLIRNDASLKSDADALVGLLLKGASMPWSELVRRLVDGASDGLDHLGELGAQQQNEFLCMQDQI
jgi:hypothetical protein